MKQLKVAASAAALLALLAGCGGGGGSVDLPPVADNEVPASAGASPAAYLEFISKMESSDTGEPLGLNKIGTAPTADTAEPVDWGG